MIGNPLQIIYGVVALALVSAVGGYIWHCESVKTEYAVFKSNVELLGEKAQADADATEAADRKRKETADAETQKLRTDNAALAKRLRDARSRGSFVPPAAPTSTSPDRATFDRAELERAIQQLDAGVSGLIAEGTEAVTSLNVARRWALKMDSLPQ